MMRVFLLLAVFGSLIITPVFADDARVSERSLGKASAPIVVDEYVSLTCPHCAAFANDVLPDLQKQYVDTGKVRFIFHAYLRDAVDLRAATLAYCLDPDQFYPFVGMLFRNQSQWVLASDPDSILIQYVKLGGLPEDKAKTCMNDKALQEAVISYNMKFTNKSGVQATPTFIINNGAEKIEGDKPLAEFSAIFDRLLAAKK